MAGKYVAFNKIEDIAERYGVTTPHFIYEPHYNLNPKQIFPVIINERNDKKIELMQWGLIPKWSESAEGTLKYLNTRSDTVKEKPVTRNNFKHQRCIIPVNGFVEWIHSEKEIFPIMFSLKSKEIMSVAGLWEEWKSPKGEIIRTFTILTTDSNELIAPVHHRMPVILPYTKVKDWLSDDISLNVHSSMLVPFPSEEIVSKRVSKLMKDVKNDFPELLDETYTGGVDVISEDKITLY